MRLSLLVVAGLAAAQSAAADPNPLPSASGLSETAAKPKAAEPPEVDLGRMRLDEGSLVAPAKSGTWAVLTLDAALQGDATRLLQQASPRSGAVVAVDLETGRVLAWAERPHGRRLRSVAATASAPAASVFKLVTTAALFERTRSAPTDRVCIAGGSHAIERRHLDAPRSGDIRCSSLYQALGHSRNAAYAQLATHRLTRADLLEVAEALGYNGKVPFDWPVPAGRLEVPYNDLEFARAAAGFQGSTLSPLGGAYLATVIAHGGLAPRLRIVASDGDYAAPSELETVGRVLSAATARRLGRMMEVTTESGTAHSAFHDDLGRPLLPGVRVAGKTGTLSTGDDDGAASWFIGFAPSRSPKIAVSVLLENGTVWRRKAAEVARDVLRSYFAARGAPRVDPPFEIATR